MSIKMDGLYVHGTSHVPVGSSRHGVLFFNSGAQPRSSRGDLNAHLADALAEKGFPSFRFDLPGLGDSAGTLPSQHLGLYQLIQQGGYADAGTRLARMVLESRQLSDLVLAGLCGGALTSVFVAERLDRAQISGLMLLDLPFFVYRAPACSNPPNAQGPAACSKRFVEPCARWKNRIHDRILQTRWEPCVTAVYQQIRRWLLRKDPRHLPADSNVRLLDALDRLAVRRVPMLLITARPPVALPAGFDYLRLITSAHPESFQHVEILGTTHSFVENGGERAVLANLLTWLVGRSLWDPRETAAAEGSSGSQMSVRTA